MIEQLEPLVRRLTFGGGVSLWKPRVRVEERPDILERQTWLHVYLDVPHAMTGEPFPVRFHAGIGSVKVEALGIEPRAWLEKNLRTALWHEVEESVRLDGAPFFGEPHPPRSK